MVRDRRCQGRGPRAVLCVHRQDGWGRAAYDPAMMVAIMLYAYAKGQRSSRGIERACSGGCRLSRDRVEPRSRSRDDQPLSAQSTLMLWLGLFGSVLTSCARAGMVRVGTIAVDGTKVHANASREANADFDQIAREILEAAAQVDAAEDELYGEKRGDEPPENLQTSQGRRGWLREAKRQLDDERAKEAKPIPGLARRG